MWCVGTVAHGAFREVSGGHTRGRWCDSIYECTDISIDGYSSRLLTAAAALQMAETRRGWIRRVVPGPASRYLGGFRPDCAPSLGCVALGGSCNLQYI